MTRTNDPGEASAVTGPGGTVLASGASGATGANGASGAAGAADATTSHRPAPAIGAPLPRVDGPLKVCGLAPYTGDRSVPRMAHAVLVTSTIPSGRVLSIDAAAARRAPGVVAVLTPFDAMRLPEAGRAAMKPPQGRVLSLLQDAQVHYAGQPIALVVAETVTQAAGAAALVQARYEVAPAALDFQTARAGAYSPGKVQDTPADSSRGDPDRGLAGAAHRVAVDVATPYQHHNPMEPHATLATWDGDRLTVEDSTQYVAGVRRTLAACFGLPIEQVRVRSAFVGGAFGGKGAAWSHVVLAALAARQVGRPVRLVMQRPQLFGPVGGRPRTEQRIELGADREGRLVGIDHRSVSNTSTIEDWVEPAAMSTRMLYACENVATSHRLVRLNLGTPTFQRAPGEATGSFALESALDELAERIGLDPIELRLRNHADRDPDRDLPFSSKSLRACYRAGAERIGWARRSAVPATLERGRVRVGLGMATATRPAKRMPCAARVVISADGRALVQSSTADLGTGTYTVMAQIAADALGMPVDRVRFELGDTRLPEAPVSAGSMTVESVGSAVHAACVEARARLARDGAPVEVTLESKPGEASRRYSMHAFGAVFVEAHVDLDLGTVRVPRVVGAYGVGRLMNERTAHSQLMGGIVWGLSQALMEAALPDPRIGRVVNANLAEYHVPVNADIGTIETLVVPEEDRQVNALGAKGLGEVSMTGVAAAVANAVAHATGRRIRELPITPERLIG